MANQKHLDVLKTGVTAWNKWREENPGLRPDLSGAPVNAPLIGDWNSQEARQLRELEYLNVDISYRQTGRLFLPRPNFGGADLSGADFSGVNLEQPSFQSADLRHANLGNAYLLKADFTGATLYRADLTGAFVPEAKFAGADLTEANLTGSNLYSSDFECANLSRASLAWANLGEANLREANLASADLTGSQLVRTNLQRANLAGCRVYGISAWDVRLDEATKQENLVITPEGESAITVDNIKIAQFIYQLLSNPEIRDIIDTITSKAVLILGRFSPERKIILDRLREELRTRDFVPIMFDFEKAQSRDTVETIRILAGMAKFIIADLTEAKAVVQELQAIVPNLPSVAIRFIIRKSDREPGMLDHIKRFPWVVDGAFEYENVAEVLASIYDKIIGPAQAKLLELRQTA
jgi:uncharacterized protein YjbI with pentapeptide repeats